MVRVDELCRAELMNDYKCEAQISRLKVEFILNNTAKTFTKAIFLITRMDQSSVKIYSIFLLPVPCR